MARSPLSFRSQVLEKEVISYEGSEKFKNKVEECDGRVEMKWTEGRVGEIFKILTKMVRGKKSILDLGSACGGITKKMKTFAPADVRMVGVDLVPPGPATHAIWRSLKAGEVGYKGELVPKHCLMHLQ